MAAERLQKILARAGIASRRMAEKMILAGQVSVNGRVVTELGTKADAEHDSIRVNGKALSVAREKIYLALHKPPECVATMHDPEGRPTIANCLGGIRGRVFPVGRLDYHAAGLLLVTNDGEWANRILRAAGRLPQVYWLKVKGRLERDAAQEVERRAGTRLRLGKDAPNPWYEATLADARRDLLRRALTEAGHPVEKLRRVKFGAVELASLAPGRYRPLTPEEVRGLAHAADKAARVGAGREGRPRRRAARKWKREKGRRENGAR